MVPLSCVNDCDPCGCLIEDAPSAQDPVPDRDNTPLQEQIEQADKGIELLEDALNKTVDVIAALMGERKDLHEQLYQAQVDAQEWQNKFRDENAVADGRIPIIQELTNEVAELTAQRDTWQAAYHNGPMLGRRTADVERIQQLTAQNTRLELRNENQKQIILQNQRDAKKILKILR